MLAFIFIWLYLCTRGATNCFSSLCCADTGAPTLSRLLVTPAPSSSAPLKLSTNVASPVTSQKPVSSPAPSISKVLPSRVAPSKTKLASGRSSVTGGPAHRVQGTGTVSRHRCLIHDLSELSLVGIHLLSSQRCLSPKLWKRNLQMFENLVKYIIHSTELLLRQIIKMVEDGNSDKQGMNSWY